MYLNVVRLQAKFFSHSIPKFSGAVMTGEGNGAGT